MASGLIVVSWPNDCSLGASLAGVSVWNSGGADAAEEAGLGAPDELAGVCAELSDGGADTAEEAGLGTPDELAGVRAELAEGGGTGADTLLAAGAEAARVAKRTRE